MVDLSHQPEGDPPGEDPLFFVVSPTDTGVADRCIVCTDCVAQFVEDDNFDVKRVFPYDALRRTYGCDSRVGCGDVIDNPTVDEDPDIRPLPRLKITRTDGSGRTVGSELPRGGASASIAWDAHGGVPGSVPGGQSGREGVEPEGRR